MAWQKRKKKECRFKLTVTLANTTISKIIILKTIAQGICYHLCVCNSIKLELKYRISKCYCPFDQSLLLISIFKKGKNTSGASRLDEQICLLFICFVQIQSSSLWHQCYLIYMSFKCLLRTLSISLFNKRANTLILLKLLL